MCVSIQCSCIVYYWLESFSPLLFCPVVEVHKGSLSVYELCKFELKVVLFKNTQKNNQLYYLNSKYLDLYNMNVIILIICLYKLYL